MFSKLFLGILLITATVSLINTHTTYQNEQITEIVKNMYIKLSPEEIITNRGTDSIANELKDLMSQFFDELKKISTVSDPTSETEAKKYLEEIIPKYNDIKKEISKNFTLMGDIFESIRPFINGTRPNIRSFDYSSFKDKKLKRQYKYLAERLSTVFDPYATDYKSMFYSQYDYSDMNEFINKEPEEYKKFWLSQRGATTTNIFEASGAEEILLSLLRKFDTPSKSLDAKYTIENYFDKVKSVLEKLRPFYLQLHAYVRHALQQKYGKEIVSDKGAIPHHLIEQIELQSRYSDATFDYPFAEKGFPIILDSFKKEGLSSKDLMKKCNEFYESIGFSHLPDKFWENNIHFENCRQYEEANIVLSTTEESFLQTCEVIDFKTYLQMYVYLGKLHYDDLTRTYPTSFMDEPYPGFTQSIGKAVRLSVLSPEYLKKVGFLADDKIDVETNLNRLYRIAIQSIFRMSQFHVYEKFWYNFIDITTKTNNCDYWKMEYKFRGIEPPTLRNGNNFDVRADFLYSTEYLLDIFGHERYSPVFEDILGYSIYKYLCTKSGEYIPGDEKHPLNKCSFYGNKEAGKLLISTLSSDRTDYWYEIFEKVYGDDVGLDASGILEYFKPLIEWLEKENKKNNVFIGWEEPSSFVEECN